MARPTELALAESMAARLCHDLVGSVGAVANGVELLADSRSRPDPEVVDLVAQSARQASRRLQAFRVAYGTGNALPGSGMFAEVRRLANALCEGGRVTLDWGAPDGALENAATKDAARLLLNTVLMAIDTLPRGGTVKVAVAVADTRLKVGIEATGNHIGLPEEVRTMLTGEVETVELTPRNVVAYLARRSAQEVGGTFVFTAGAQGCSFAFDVPAGT
ncbi:MAG: histidine phosphotransferase [Alphaproteobacteria bacterium]|nr:histidine phosphotransferase [Alphaproteobacteria bacterium]